MQIGEWEVEGVFYIAVIVAVTMSGLLFMLTSIRRIPEGHRGVLFRMGRLVKELPPGTAWVVPLFDSVMLVNLSEQTFALPPDLTISNGEKFRVEGSFTCKIIQPIPAVMVAMQARQDIADVVGNKLVDEIKLMGSSTAIERPAQAQEWALDALNQKMSAAWQLKFTKVEFRLTHLSSTD